MCVYSFHNGLVCSCMLTIHHPYLPLTYIPLLHGSALKTFLHVIHYQSSRRRLHHLQGCGEIYRVHKPIFRDFRIALLTVKTDGAPSYTLTLTYTLLTGLTTTSYPSYTVYMYYPTSHTSTSPYTWWRKQGIYYSCKKLLRCTRIIDTPVKPRRLSASD